AQSEPVVLGVLSDLFFGVKVAEAAKKAGGRMRMVRSEEELLALAANAPALIVFDLQLAQPKPTELLRALKADAALAGIPTVGYFSHVQEELRREALAAGCDQVMPRSVFTQRVDELVSGYVQRAHERMQHQ
ncbi:MAG: hypothetical protein LC114_21070, partial [Bryobacterales bacterium]|nr:hypothetical protein [Bryobacterales bacterium]